MTTLIQITAAQIEPHPRNPRRAVGDVDELAKSIAKHGILEPLIVAPGCGPDAYRLIAGHRRAAANAVAYPDGEQPMPALLRDDLTDDAAQLEAMLIENIHRADLTPVEEATAYSQLRIDYGYKPTDIARTTGRRKALVDRRLSLMRLPERLQERLHGGQVTLGEAERMVEFAGDPEALEDLERYAGTSNFEWRANWHRTRKEQAAAHRKAVADAEQAGARLVSDSDLPRGWAWNRPDEHATAPVSILADDQVRDEHAQTCPHHVLVDDGESLTPACADPAVHGDAAPGATLPRPTGPDPEAERIRAGLAAAAECRRQFVDSLPTKLDTGQRRTMLAAAVALTMCQMAEDGDDDAYNELAARLGLMPVPDGADADTWDDHLRDMAGQVAGWPVDRLVKATLASAMRAIEPELAHQWRWQQVGPRVWLGNLGRLGYEPCDLERDLLAEGSTEDNA